MLETSMNNSNFIRKDQHTERYIIHSSHSTYSIVDTQNKAEEDYILAVTLIVNYQREKAYQKAAFITALLNAYDRGPVSIVDPIAETYAQENIQERLEKMEFAFTKIKNWCRAYPLEIFDEPDMKKARDVLSAADIEISCIAVSNMRYVLKGIQEIIDPYLTEVEREKINASLA